MADGETITYSSKITFPSGSGTILLSFLYRTLHFLYLTVVCCYYYFRKETSSDIIVRQERSCISRKWASGIGVNSLELIMQFCLRSLIHISCELAATQLFQLGEPHLHWKLLGCVSLRWRSLLVFLKWYAAFSLVYSNSEWNGLHTFTKNDLFSSPPMWNLTIHLPSSPSVLAGTPSRVHPLSRLSLLAGTSLVSGSNTICNDSSPPLANIVPLWDFPFGLFLKIFKTCLLGRGFHTLIKNVLLSSPKSM